MTRELPARFRREAIIAGVASMAVFLYPSLTSAAPELYTVVTSPHASAGTMTRALITFGGFLPPLAIGVFLFSLAAGTARPGRLGALRLGAAAALILMAAGGASMALQGFEILGSASSAAVLHMVRIALAVHVALYGCWCLLLLDFTILADPLAHRATAILSAVTLVATILQGDWSGWAALAHWGVPDVSATTWVWTPLVVLWLTWLTVCLCLAELSWSLLRRDRLPVVQ